MKTLDEAIKKYPIPRFTIWYRAKFPKKQFIIVESFLFLVGFVSTIIGNKLDEKSDLRKLIAYLSTFLATIFFALFLAIVGVLFSIAWVLMRKIEIKRAGYMGVSLQEYWQILNSLTP